MRYELFSWFSNEALAHLREVTVDAVLIQQQDALSKLRHWALKKHYWSIPRIAPVISIGKHGQVMQLTPL